MEAISEIWLRIVELPDIYLNEPIFQRALLAGVMVGITCGVLGCFFVLRNMALIGDALSHAILPGLVFAFVFFGYNTFAFFIGSTMAGMITAVLITWISQNIRTKADAAIGIVFTFMFAIGIIAISRVSRVQSDSDEATPHLDMAHFLFGNLLGVETSDLYLTGFVMIYVLASIYFFYRYLFVATFQEVIAETMGISVKYLHYFLMLLLSFAVVASLQSVGLILVVAMLITPASTALLLSDKLKVVIIYSAIIGAITGILGMSIAIVLDAPPGPALVVVVSFMFFVAALFAPKKGYFSRLRQRIQLRTKIQLEDTLKQSFRLQNKHQLNLNALLEKLSFNKSMLLKHLRTLNQQGFVTMNAKGESLKLTNQGIKEANRLVRAHRLWETYLVQRMGLTEGQIHEDAEKYEHLLTDELLDEVDQTLGYPTKDPHGSPIPTKKGFPDTPLLNLLPQESAIITSWQMNDEVNSKLWQMGLLPKSTITVNHKEADYMIIQCNGHTLEVPTEIARRINIEQIEKMV